MSLHAATLFFVILLGTAYAGPRQGIQTPIQGVGPDK